MDERERIYENEYDPMECIDDGGASKKAKVALVIAIIAVAFCAASLVAYLGEFLIGSLSLITSFIPLIGTVVSIANFLIDIMIPVFAVLAIISAVIALVIASGATKKLCGMPILNEFGAASKTAKLAKALATAALICSAIVFVVWLVLFVIGFVIGFVGGLLAAIGIVVGSMGL